ncbi:MAG TPA: addiction module protein, partial [Longimicrobium sp.]|nr:addiction module protein [Longimicrobium sp.]
RVPIGVWTVHSVPRIFQENPMPGERKPMSIDELTAAVLDLPPRQRAALIEKVEDSLYPVGDIDPAALDKARRELADMKAGRVKGIPMEQLLDELDRMAE